MPESFDSVTSPRMGFPSERAAAGLGPSGLKYNPFGTFKASNEHKEESLTLLSSLCDKHRKAEVWYKDFLSFLFATLPLFLSLSLSSDTLLGDTQTSDPQFKHISFGTLNARDAHKHQFSCCKVTCHSIPLTTGQIMWWPFFDADILLKAVGKYFCEKTILFNLMTVE